MTAVESAEKTLTEVEASPWDVAIAAVALPGMDGIDLIGKMQKVCPGIKTIVITGQGSREIEQRALEQGVFAYAEKPFSVKELTGLVWMAVSAGA